MAITRNPKRPIKYVLKAERELPKEEQTVCAIRGLDKDEFFEVQGLIHSDGVGTANKAALIGGLAGWDNLKGGDGVAVEYKTTEVEGETICSPDNLNHILGIDNGIAVMELIKAIRDHSALTEEDEKNSPSADCSSQDS